MSWTLISNRGRQIWNYLRTDSTVEHSFDRTNPNALDKVYRCNVSPKFHLDIDQCCSSLPQNYLNNRINRSVVEQTIRGLNYYLSLQDDDGHWPADYGGPLFLMAGALIASYVTKFQFEQEQRAEMIRYLFNHQSSIDAGWGNHIESHSTMFGTVLNYISLRILGVEPNDHRLSKARQFIRQHGGPCQVPSWAKFWLCLMNLMPWNGINSILPELWLLPEWFPFHPSKLWCHSRMVYLSMSYIYSRRISAPVDSFIEQLRDELYDGSFDRINFSQHRNSVSSIDLYVAQTNVLKCLFYLLNIYESIHNENIRQRAERHLFELIEGEDRQTSYIDIGPVNKFLNMVAVHHGRGRTSQQFQMHLDRVQDYLWLSEDGMKIQGYNGSQLWDTVFSVQSIVETNFDQFYASSLLSAYRYIDMTQVNEDVEDWKRFYRHQSKGGWPFSTKDHGWPITDCTGEALKAVLILNEKSYFNDVDRIDDERLKYSIDFILSLQNNDGGWASYELQRSSSFLELFNPSEIFSRIMVDYSYVECTSSCLQALNKYRSVSTYRNEDIQKSIERGQQFLLNQQRPDGSWYGSWAICFTYATWFAVEALIQTGLSNTSTSIKRARDFLLSKQNNDGGWGESIYSSIKQIYINDENSQVVQTSWAILALILADGDRSSIERAIQFLLSKQTNDGDWIQSKINGIFNGTCAISYTNYRNIFPIWALGRFIRYSSSQCDN